MKNRKSKMLFFAFLCALGILLVPHAALANESEMTVSNFSDLQSAISSATGTEENPTVINVTGTIEVTETLEITDAKSITLTGGGTLQCVASVKNAIEVIEDGTLTLENITVSGNNHSNGYLVYLNRGGKLIMNEDASLQDNDNTAVYLNGTVSTSYGVPEFHMNGGTIKNNEDQQKSGCGAAVFIKGSLNCAPLLEMTGGSITENTVASSGAGIYLDTNGEIKITGGKITGNTVLSNDRGCGGGIAISRTATNIDPAVSISGATIADNTAPNRGANLYSEADLVIGENVNIPSGLYIDEDYTVLLTGIPTALGFDKMISSYFATANWRTLVKMQDGSEVTDDIFSKLVMTAPEQSLVLGDDGAVHLGNPATSGYRMSFISGSNGNYTPVGSQSGEKWTWDEETLTLTITGDLTCSGNTGSSSKDYALSMPDGATIIIENDATLTVNNPDFYGIYSIGSLTIKGGHIKTNSGGSWAGDIYVPGKLDISGTALEMTCETNDANHVFIRPEELTMDNCTLVVTGTGNSDYAIRTDYGNISIINSNVTINHAFFGIYAYTKDELGLISVDNSSFKVVNEGYGIAAIHESIYISNSTLDIQSIVGLHTEGTKTEELVKLTNTSGTIGQKDNPEGMAIEVGLKDETTPIDGRLIIDTLPYGFTIQKINTQDEADPWYAAAIVNTSTGLSGYIKLPVPADEITLDQSSLTLTTGSSATLTASISPADSDQSVTWSSSDSSVAMVDTSGKVTAVAPGTAKITAATANGLTATCSVTVKSSEPPYTGKYSYEITTSTGDNGTLTVDRYATEGDTVTIQVTPDQAYKLDDLSVTANGKEVEVTDNHDGTFSFTMPSADVKITATFAEDPDWTPDEPEEPSTDVSDIFTDVAPNAWYKDAVQYAYDHGLMTGVSATEFAPEQTTTRAMIVSILARLENVTTAQAAGFADVDDEWYATAVNWAANVGVVNGYEDGTFKPNTAITREQLAAILMNYSAYKGEDVSARADLSAYTDQPSAWAEETMSWAVAEGLITGVTADTLQPQGAATRAQVAAILQRFLSE